MENVKSTTKKLEAELAEERRQLQLAVAARCQAEAEVARWRELSMTLEETLRRRNADLTTLNTIATTAGQSPSLEQAFLVILDKTLELTGIQAGAIHMVDDEGQMLHLKAQRGLPAELLTRIQSIVVGDGPLGQAAKWGRPIVLDKSLDKWGLICSGDDQQDAPGVAGLPIQSHNRGLGILSVFVHDVKLLNPHELQLLIAIANQIGVVIENTRRAEQAAQIEILRELNRLRSELIANASHELRTPLGLIKVFCTSLMAQDVAFDEDTRRQFLQGIDEETDKLKIIVDNLLGLSTLESGRMRLEKHVIDLRALTRKVIESIQLDMRSASAGFDGNPVAVQHHFVCDFPNHPLTAPVDEKRIEQVLRNLLNNAVKYSPKGGRITIQGRGDKWQVLIRISDGGIGITPENLEHIFERFYRVENERTRTIGGVGLGLAVCKGIVETHGGRIWAESTLNEGSHFYFTLPVDENFTVS
ncbi:MAG: GAF domain-containing protein [Anaerolineae bacterium]|nr:GAF domain-containing protein [Anaerolineae bacterium]